MEMGAGAGFAVAPDAIENYVNTVVNEAIKDMTTTATELQATTNVSWNSLVGQANLPGSTRFTTAAKDMLTAFFDLHHAITAGQQDMLNKIIGFRDQLVQTKDTYLQADDDVRQSFKTIDGRLGGGHGTA